MRLLIENGADIDAVDIMNNTALNIAIMNGIYKNVWNFNTKSSKTIFIYHPFLGHDKVAEILIRNNANVNVVNADGNTALISTIPKGIKCILRAFNCQTY